MKHASAAGTCHIVAAGPREPLSFDVGAQDLVIAADGGYAYCIECGIVPDLLVADYDSLDKGAVSTRPDEVVELPWEKDDTDTVAAVRRGLERGYRDFHIYCGLGGDLGHSMANVQTLLYLRAQGCDGAVSGGGQVARIVAPSDGLREFAVEPGTRVSVFAVGGPAHGVTERGLHWELEDAELDPSFPLGVSNQAQSQRISIGVGEGSLLVVIG